MIKITIDRASKGGGYLVDVYTEDQKKEEGFRVESVPARTHIEAKCYAAGLAQGYTQAKLESHGIAHKVDVLDYIKQAV